MAIYGKGPSVMNLRPIPVIVGSNVTLQCMRIRYYLA
jgi:hypothetical protein